MSRSRKKVPGWVDRNPFMKNYANRRLRRKPLDYEIANGNAYRKEQCSYDICDHKWLYYNSVQVMHACHYVMNFHLDGYSYEMVPYKRYELYRK